MYLGYGNIALVFDAHTHVIEQVYAVWHNNNHSLHCHSMPPCSHVHMSIDHFILLPLGRCCLWWEWYSRSDIFYCVPVQKEWNNRYWVHRMVNVVNNIGCYLHYYVTNCRYGGSCGWSYKCEFDSGLWGRWECGLHLAMLAIALLFLHGNTIFVQLLHLLCVCVCVCVCACLCVCVCVYVQTNYSMPR